MTDLNQLRFGRSIKPSGWLPLHAGPISLHFDPDLGDLRYLRLGDRELVRRIYVAVRDRNWSTVPAILSGHHLEERDGGFVLRFLAMHNQREIALAWAAEISGDATGRITYEMSGQALTTFMRNRIGICVLHPAHESAGRPCTVEHTDGSTEEGAFPLHIAPHQPFIDIHSLFVPLDGHARAALTFTGDVFEMEDQRNWTDASFKTYSTPLSLPYPAEIRAATKIDQSVTLTIEGVDLTAPAPTMPAASGPVTIGVGRAPLGLLPNLGLGFAAIGPDTVTRLQEMMPSHLRLDLDLGGKWRDALSQGAAAAGEVGAPLELALMLPDEPREALADLSRALTKEMAAVTRVLAFARDSRQGDDGTIAAARSALAGHLPAAEFGGGTDAYFTDLNRVRPALGQSDFVTYCLTPQVHAFDYASLVETLPTQAWTVTSARRLYPGLPVCISPVTLKPRPRPDRETVPAGPGDLPDHYDPRQPSLFTAGWTVGSLKYLSRAGIHSLTYFEAAGPGGVLDEERVYPVYHVLADVLEPEEAVTIPTLSDDALRAEAFAFRFGRCTRVIVANLTLDALAVRLVGLGGVVGIRRLDETTAAVALEAPAEYRAGGWVDRVTEGGEIELELPPCGLATLDTW